MERGLAMSSKMPISFATAYGSPLLCRNGFGSAQTPSPTLSRQASHPPDLFGATAVFVNAAIEGASKFPTRLGLGNRSNSTREGFARERRRTLDGALHDEADIESCDEVLGERLRQTVV
jgi:hypothetical protein